MHRHMRSVNTSSRSLLPKKGDRKRRISSKDQYCTFGRGAPPSQNTNMEGGSEQNEVE